MVLKLYNTRTRKKEEFQPLDPKNVRMYVCGPTVYDNAHIGNARPVIVFDVLYRLLRHVYGAHHVKYVRNITDVDDKINARAAERYPDLPLNESIRKLTTETTEQFHKDVAALGCLPPTLEPRATDYIEQMKEMIVQLYEADIAYVAEDHVLFSVAAYGKLETVPAYGSLARRSLDEMIAGARVEVAPYKRDPVDFVLWKPSKDGEPGWMSPLNIRAPGRPGWHLECSAMSKALLGDEFDIHGGGIDLVFPHHENEVAQSCAANRTAKMANVWMHNGHLQVEGAKMSKSDGNFVTIKQHFAGWGDFRWSGADLKLAMLSTHYRRPIDWTVKKLEQMSLFLCECHNFAKPANDQPPSKRFINALSDDLNTPLAISILYEDLKASRDFLMSGKSVGIGTETKIIDVDGFNQAGKDLAANLNFLGINADKYSLPEYTSFDRYKIGELITARAEARKEKDWAEADRIRDELADMRVALKDTKDPATGEIVTTWEIAR